MSKFNKTTIRTAVFSPVATQAVPTAFTHEGGPGYRRDTKSELFLLAVSNMVGEDTFYENARNRDDRYTALVRQVATDDSSWMRGFVTWLRGKANLRSASMVAAAEAVKARLDTGPTAGDPTNRALINAVLQRADEPGELLAYWQSRFGRALPKPVKRGVGDAVRRLYTEYAMLKYDTASKGFRFGDVLNLVHADPATPAQGDLFRVALDRRHHGDHSNIGPTLPMLAANQRIRDEAGDNPEILLDPDRLRAAGMTWEDVLSLAGSTVDKSRLWTALIPSMGYMALLRNLRNFDQAGVDDDVAATVAARLSDPDQVARSRQFPFRFLAAYRNAPSLRWGHALDQALTASLSNVPELPGRTLILIDISGSMAARMSGKSELNRSDAARVFGAALAMRTDATLVWFHNRSERVEVPKGGSLLRLINSIPKPTGGTRTADAVTRWYRGHDRVVIVTDEQAADNVHAAVPAQVPLYTWNLGGYRVGHAPSGSGNRHTFGGLTDAAFRLLPLLEAGRSATWPWVR
jgi:hypothetical protein